MTKELLKFARANKRLTIDQIATKFVYEYCITKTIKNDKRKILT